MFSWIHLTIYVSLQSRLIEGNGHWSVRIKSSVQTVHGFLTRTVTDTIQYQCCVDAVLVQYSQYSSELYDNSLRAGSPLSVIIERRRVSPKRSKRSGKEESGVRRETSSRTRALRTWICSQAWMTVNRPILINLNSTLALKLRWIKQRKSHRGWAINNWYRLHCFIPLKLQEVTK